MVVVVAVCIFFFAEVVAWMFWLLQLFVVLDVVDEELFSVVALAFRTVVVTCH